MTTDTIPKWKPDVVKVGDVVKIGRPPVSVVVVSIHKRESTARKHATRSEQWRFTTLPCAGWVVIQPVDHEGYVK